jgi:hypothetical protein
MKPYQLILFPLDGPEITVPLPAELPTSMNVLAFSSDGRAIYSQKADPLNRSNGIYKIEFQPTRAGVVPGSVGLGDVCLGLPPSSGRIVVEGWSWTFNNRGVFEIDPDAATIRPLPAGSASSCGGAGGSLSPDGKRAVRKNGKKLELVYLETGMSRAIKGVSADASCIWSPNGQRFECSGDGGITVIDANDISRQKRFSGGLGEWSPDSKYLLRVKSRFFCFDFGSLEALDMETGKRKAIKSSDCRISGGRFGWIDQTVVTK